MITEVRDSIITRFFALLMIPSLLMVTTASCKKEIQPELSTQQSVVQYTAEELEVKYHKLYSDITTALDTATIAQPDSVVIQQAVALLDSVGIEQLVSDFGFNSNTTEIIDSYVAANGSLENFFEDVSSHSFNSDTEVTYLLSYVAAMNYVAVSYAAAGSPPPPWDCLRASAGLACSVFGLILGPPTLGATFYISIAGLANSLHSVSTDCFD
jgi:hypothetical protein